MDKARTVLRLYADASGESRFDEIDVTLKLADFAPPAPPLYMSDPAPATRYTLIHLPAGWSGEQHPSPKRQILFCLSGRMTVIASTGDRRIVAAGDVWLMEDTTGKGHVTEVDTAAPVEAAIVQLE